MQARLALENQRQADLTAIRTQQQAADADVERQRTLLSQQYASAIRQAQADNDMQRAQALYVAAKEDDAALLQKQQEAASLMAGAGDYALYASLYGLTDTQRGTLESAYKQAQAAAQSTESAVDLEGAAKLMASAGDFSLYGQLYGLTDAQIAKLRKQWADENGIVLEDEPAGPLVKPNLPLRSGGSETVTGTGDKSRYLANYLQ